MLPLVALLQHPVYIVKPKPRVFPALSHLTSDNVDYARPLTSYLRVARAGPGYAARGLSQPLSAWQHHGSGAWPYHSQPSTDPVAIIAEADEDVYG